MPPRHPRSSFLSVIGLAVALNLLLPGRGALAADWPQHRRDAARSAITAEGLTFPMSEAWRYEPAGPPEPAWPDPGKEAPRLDFEAAPAPVVANGLVYVASTSDDTLRALDAATGAVCWRFTAGGPLRFAPACGDGRVFQGSDDGNVYALDGATGKLLWTYDASPRQDRLVGNGRLISRWPCRTGTLLYEGALYTTAGNWPWDGVFVSALDPATGKPLWVNDTADFLFMPLPHFPAHGMSGLTPQGYLLAGRDVLLVPTGRGYPAAFDRKTGKLLLFEPGQGGGGTWNTIDQARSLVYSGQAYSIAEIAGVWDAPVTPRGFQWQQIIRTVPHPNYQSAATLIASPKGLFTAANGRVKGPGVDAPTHGEVLAMIMAGDALVLGGQGQVTAVRGTEQLWRANNLAGGVRGLAVADGTLIATTDRGVVYAFVSGRGAGRVVTDGAGGGADRPADGLRELVAGLGAGFALVFDRDASLAMDLAAASDMRVVACLQDASKVPAERRRVLAAGMSGARVQVESAGDGGDLPYPQMFANLVVVKEAPKGVSGAELWRVVRPCGGMLWAPGGEPGRLLAGADDPAPQTRSIGGLSVAVKGKLPGAADWNSREPDMRVKWPLEFLWYGDPGASLMMDRHKAMPPLAANGRVILRGMSALIALDAYNGAVLWHHWIPGATIARTVSRVTANDQQVFVEAGSVGYELDAATGRTLHTYGTFAPSPRVSLAQPQRFAGPVGQVSVERVPGAVRVTLTAGYGPPKGPDAWDLFFDFRPETERVKLLERGAFQFRVVAFSGAVTAGAGPAHPALAVRPADGGTVVLDLPDAEVRRLLGAAPREFSFAAALTRYDHANLTESSYHVVAGTGGALNDGWPTFVLDGPPGEAVNLSRHVDGPKDGFAKAPAGGGVAMHRPTPPPFPPQRTHPLLLSEGPKVYKRSYACGRVTRSPYLDILRSGTLALYDLADDSGLRNVAGMRSACTPSAMTALGLLIDGPGSSGCSCGYSFQTSVALAPTTRRRNEDWAMFWDALPDEGEVKAAAVNLGAPGDRRDAHGKLWLGFPRPPFMRGADFLDKQTQGNPLHMDLPVTVRTVGDGGPVRVHTDWHPIAGTDRPWIYGSGWAGLARASVDLLTFNRLSVPSRPCGTAPRIDGVLDDACWNGAYGRSLTKERNHLDPRSFHDVWFRHDATNLYVAYEQRPRVDASGVPVPFKAAVKAKDGPVWNDDSVNLRLIDDAQAATVHFGVSASGARYDSLWKADMGKEDPGRDLDWKSASRTGEAFTVEMAIPWAALEAAGLKRGSLRLALENVGPQSFGNGGLERWLKPVAYWLKVKPRILGERLVLSEEALPERSFTVRLHFAEIEGAAAGDRVFDVKLQGREVLKAFDIAREATGPMAAIAREFRGVRATDAIVIEATPAAGSQRPPLLGGIEIQAE